MRSILGLVYTIDAMKNMGVQTDAVLHRHGIELKKIDPGAFIERDRELAILNDLVLLLDDPHAGISLGERFGLAGYGPFSMLLMTCRHALEACEMGIYYQKITYLNSHLSLQRVGNSIALIFAPTTVPGKLGRFLMDKDISGTLKLVRDISRNIGVEINLKEAFFNYPTPADLTTYFSAINSPMQFGANEGKLVFAANELTHPFSSANSTAFKLYRSQCDALLKASEAEPIGLAENVRKHLSLFVYNIPTISEVAHTFNTTERTLRRKLSLEQSSYQKLVDQVRYEKAKSLLRQSASPIEQIADKLGYREPASFNHAFSRWSGLSPSAFRRQASKDTTP
jgi:AraC-like DNA-binding protein